MGKWDEKYIEHVLKPSFDQARSYFFDPMLLASMAHVIMLSEQGIMDREEAKRVLVACKELMASGSDDFEYDPNYEDLFFIMESRLAERAGVDAVGNMHVAMSRNDLDTTMYRLVLRNDWFVTAEALSNLRAKILELANEHSETLMPAHTHNQQAQPTTLGHYLAGVESVLARDMKRWLSQWERLNQSPLGAAALGTSGYKIDRRLTAQLLGFDDIVENSYDAVGGADYSAEMAAVTQVLLIGLSRFTHDLLFWATNEANIITLDSSLIQVSSIMPQKRNPVVLEHTRAFIRRGVSEAQAAIQLMGNVPYGDINDVNDNLQPNLRRMHEATTSVLELLTVVMGGITVNSGLLRNRLEAGFAPITELADTLVREVGITFRQAHAVASKVVDRLKSEPNPLQKLDRVLLDEISENVLGRSLNITDKVITQACDPAYFVRVRKVEGGPAPEVLRAHLQRAKDRLQEDERQVINLQETLNKTMEDFERRIELFLER